MPCSVCKTVGHNRTTCKKRLQDNVDESMMLANSIKESLIPAQAKLATDKATLAEVEAGGKGGVGHDEPTEWEEASKGVHAQKK